MGQDWGWDRQVIPKRRQYIITARCVITQKSSVLCRYVALITLFVARRGISDRKTRLWTLPWQWWTPKHHHPFPVYERTPPLPLHPLHRVLPKGPFINRYCWRQLLAGIETNMWTIALLQERFLVTDLQVCRHQQAYRCYVLCRSYSPFYSAIHNTHVKKIYAMRNTARGGDNTQFAVFQDYRSGVHGPHSRVYSMTHLCRGKIKWLLGAVVILYREILCIILMEILFLHLC